MEIRGTQLLSHSVAAGTGDSVPRDKEQGSGDHRTTSRREKSVEGQSGGAGNILPGQETSLIVMEIMTAVTVLLGLPFLPLCNGGWWCPPHRALVRSKHVNLCKD